jgi:hypothetical protein
MSKVGKHKMICGGREGYLQGRVPQARGSGAPLIVVERWPGSNGPMARSQSTKPDCPRPCCRLGQGAGVERDELTRICPRLACWDDYT